MLSFPVTLSIRFDGVTLLNVYICTNSTFAYEL